MSSFNAIFSPIIVVFHCEVENRFHFTFKGVQGVKKSFQEVKIKILSYKTNILRKKFSFHAIFLSNIVVYYYPSKKSFFFTSTDFQGVKTFQWVKIIKFYIKIINVFSIVIFVSDQDIICKMN